VFGYFGPAARRRSTFQAVDGMPVDLVFLLLSAAGRRASIILKALASVSRTFRDRQTLAKLAGARSKDALFALLAGEETRDA
jgi:PTS system nitrogen regulatory IIA component